MVVVLVVIITVASLYRSNIIKTHVYAMLGFYHNEKHSTLVCDLVRQVSST